MNHGFADTAEWLALDQRHVWHPYASLTRPPQALPVVAAHGVRLQLADGSELIDGMASWWSAIHGYNHPVLNRAARNQLDAMSHVMFGGITHPAAVKLCKLLVDITPAGLDKVFISDSGSVAVEVAIKMALQYWVSTGHRQKHRLLTLKRGYHGDTFMAMSVCDPVTGMHHLFSEILPEQLFADAPQCRFGDTWQPRDLDDFRRLLQAHHHQLAAVILEPVVQGTGGMNFYHPEFVREVRALCTAHDVLLIHDEIATGFGRTGKLFASEHAGVSPDILCVGKALTGGYLSLAATLCNERVARGICEGEAGVFMHGPTFMGNALACAIACASIELLISQPWQRVVAHIAKQLNQGLAAARALPQVADVRVLGGIGVIELHQPVDMARAQAAATAQGVWLRPFGRLIYTMPPYVMDDADLASLCRAMVSAAEAQP
ncbi:MAG TPA: adenosylmethionine--8-amino-7-oxononanoate transaminase [Spongiibacteraceae bacterium]|nr:adenosylmethionine--8-amino-7-oxononanoate transaminase [Spongiibacteraceae bacterium]